MAYCGMCYNEQGLFRKLLGPFLTRRYFQVDASKKHEEEIYLCTFCQAERRKRTLFSRIQLLPFKQTTEARVHHFPQVVNSIGVPQ